ncbi:MAG: hypothetical protein IIW75_00945, partial [Bacteroidaceae bacterium]|nr:hypothetical protein [Bacteroidaceae bacterium]
LVSFGLIITLPPRAVVSARLFKNGENQLVIIVWLLSVLNTRITGLGTKRKSRDAFPLLLYIYYFDYTL